MFITLSSCIFLAVLYYTLCMDKDLESFIRDLIPSNAATTAAQAAASSDFSSACARSDTIASPPPQKLEKGAWGGADAAVNFCTPVKKDKEGGDDGGGGEGGR